MVRHLKLNNNSDEEPEVVNNAFKMADDDEDGLNPVDQGTLLMLCLSLGLAVIASFWFACEWYRKRSRKNQGHVRPHRTRLKQTFSRFSQVDEEVTMHNINDNDAVILQTYSVQPGNDPPARAQQTQSQQTTQTRVTITGTKKPYLETDI